MRNLRKKFERFCLKNRDIGIPNLMLYMCVGSGVVCFANLINGGGILYELLRFDKAAILNGQVWRLVSWLLTENIGTSPLLAVVFLYFFYRLGQNVEASIGTFKFNLFYLGGVIMMDVFAMIFCPTEDVVLGNYLVPAEIFAYFYSNMAYYLHLSMVLAFATTYPDSHFTLFFVLPVRAWVIALVDLVLIGISVFSMCYPTLLFPHCLFPLIGLLNYFIFFGPDMHNLLPLSWRAKLKRNSQKKAASKNGPKVVPFPGTSARPASTASDTPYTHRCTVCGRTDTEHPELEFRYCSRCNGYHCYCEDHISNHTHIE